MARGKAAEKGKILERRLKALEYRKAGMTYREIGERLGIDYTLAYKDVHNELKRLTQLLGDSAEELRQLELERLDGLQIALEPMARVGNPTAVAATLRVMDMRAKLLGLYSAQEVSASLEVVITHASD